MRLRDLLEASAPGLDPDVEDTLPPTMILPELINSDTYKQYRYVVALAAAGAVAKGEVEFDPNSTWNESLSALAYTPQELEIIQLANKMMGVQGVMVSKSKSHEPDHVHSVSPVMPFNMTESMRNTLDKLADE